MSILLNLFVFIHVFVAYTAWMALGHKLVQEKGFCWPTWPHRNLLPAQPHIKNS